jgi:hypothetical protein
MLCCGKQGCYTKNCLQKSAFRFDSLPLANRELTWVDVAGLFPAPQECLAAFLAIAAAEVLAGVKPANLIRIANRRLPCGRRMYRLWQKYGSELLKSSPLSALPLQIEKDSILLLIYCPELLEKRLSGRTMQTFLVQRGYPRSVSLEKALQHLQKSFSTGIPHEVGMFLGYPAKDVKGFMTQVSQPRQGRSLWRIYGPPTRSLKLNDLYRTKRREISSRLTSKRFPLQLLQAA